MKTQSKIIIFNWNTLRFFRPYIYRTIHQPSPPLPVYPQPLFIVNSLVDDYILWLPSTWRRILTLRLRSCTPTKYRDFPARMQKKYLCGADDFLRESSAFGLHSSHNIYETNKQRYILIDIYLVFWFYNGSWLYWKACILWEANNRRWYGVWPGLTFSRNVQKHPV